MYCLAATLVTALALVLATTGAAQAQLPLNARAIRAEPVKDKPLGHGKKLTVFVDYAVPEKARPKRAPSCATDLDQSDTVPHFARSAPSLDFTINSSTFPSSVGFGADTAIRDGFRAWQDAIGYGYFGLTTSASGPTGPAQDGTNAVGWSRFVNGRTLAATWTYEDQDGRITEADVFYNAKQPWGVFTSCADGNGGYEVGNIATHEIGHALGLDHLSDPGRQATLYPSAPANEVIKRTLTTGDEAGLQQALAGP